MEDIITTYYIVSSTTVSVGVGVSVSLPAGPSPTGCTSPHQTPLSILARVSSVMRPETGGPSVSPVMREVQCSASGPILHSRLVVVVVIQSGGSQ